VQVDFNLPERFDLHYTGSDGEKHRPVMIHRAPFGSLERFTGLLIEHFAGDFPVWLAPEQVRVLGISEKVTEYAEEVRAALFAAGVRVRLDMGAEKIGAKIRLAQLAKVPYMLVVGAKEAESRTLSIRSRRHGDIGVLSLSEFLDHLLPEIRERTS
jgi:threonyl-tRNA synthetase